LENLVTVVTPVAEPHVHLLPRLAHSLQLQTVVPQWLIVNDGLSSISVPEHTVLDTGGNKGTAYARNLGIDAVQTPFLLFVDADDYLIDTAVETFLKAYATYTDACYIYSDWYQLNRSKTYSIHKAKNYDRLKQVRHSLHLVTTFMPTDIAKVYFDINYRGWEDWEFHIRLGEHGFCGARIPEPLLVYDMSTSINREKHNGIQHEVYPEIQSKYAEYLEGVKEFMPCQTCGSKKRAEVVINTLPPAPEEGKVVLEYIGQNSGAIPFRVNRRTYRGGNNDTDKFVQAEPMDVEGLLNFQVFRKVAKSFKPPTPPPSVQEFEEWREINKTEVPKNWTDLFANPKNMTKITEVEESTAEPKAKRRGRPKGAKNKPNAVAVEV